MQLKNLIRLAVVLVLVSMLTIVGAISIAPEPVLATQGNCENGVVVSDPSNNTGLVSDCEALLAARDTLASPGSLDWTDDTPIADWEGINTNCV